MDLLGLLPSFGNLFFTLGAFVIALSVIVAVHEYGHYIVGRWCGIHAEVFSIGFGPVLFSGTDRHGTRWQVAALPFGGFVKFLGDSNAASAADSAAMSQLDRDQRRHTMHGAPLWARSATVAAGPAFNFVFSILVFALFLGLRGIAEDTPVVGEVHPLPTPVQELQQGDRIRAVAGTPVETLADFFRAASEIDPAPVVAYTVERDGDTREVEGPFPIPPRASGISLNSAARDAGMQVGDVILAVEDRPIHAFSELPPIVGAAEGDPVALRIWRDGEELDLALTPRRTDLPVPGGGFETRWLIGISGGLFFDGEARRPGAGEALWLGTQQTWFVASTSLSGLWHMIKGAISSCNLRGPIGIAETSGAMAADGLASFIWFIAVLSTAVGLLNLFPIPILDGGHLVFHAWEAVTGRPPSDGALRILMAIGLAFLATLMLFAIGNDLFCP